MPLAPGSQVGPYVVGAQIGVGGMGEVYSATDTNLKRSVALKVLPEALAHDADRLARFQREAELLASLNHPNIAAIYRLERTSTITALVMEFVEGPTLADRIAQGPVPVQEARPIARQIAEALEAAHERGIIHRDLKPANIKVRPDGTVKVLDFGLAKALDPAGAANTHVSMSPTITSPAMTHAGIILGTAAYMSPEQARGKDVDARTDVWAFGAVLYEMLTGKRAFAGDDVSDVLASVLAREPDWTQLPGNLSPALASYIKRCLCKDRKERIRAIGDVLLALDGAFDSAAPAASPAVAKPTVGRRVLPLGLTAIVAMLVTGLAAFVIQRSNTAPLTTRFEYVPPDGQQLASSTQRPVLALSPDGRFFLYQTTEGLFLRSMGNLDAQLIPGTSESLGSPFVSPDGQWVGYFAAESQGGLVRGVNGQLKKIAVSGGAPIVLCDATIPFGASWGADNTIVFAQRSGIMRVSANGGAPELIVPAQNGEQLWTPQMLPDGNSVLFSISKDLGPNRWDRAQVVVESLRSKKRTALLQGSEARYVATGHLLYQLGNEVLAVAFDPRRLEITGGAVPIVEGVSRPVGVNAVGSNYGVSAGGTLAYLTGGQPLRTLVWVNRNGSPTEPISAIPPGTYEEPRLSPDGSRVALTRDGDIWVYELASGRSNKITTDAASMMAVWNPNGSQLAYASARKGNLEAWVQPSDGAGEPRQLTNLGGQVHVDAWSPDGRILTIHHHPIEGSVAIYTISMETPDPEPQLFFKAGFNAEGADFSRDQRYVSYLAEKTRQREVYIRPYSTPGGETPVSVNGAREPMWVDNGEVFYRSLTGERMFAVPVKTEPKLNVEKPVELFQGPYYISPTGSPRPQYDVTSDGKRFLMLTSAAGSASAARPRVVVVEHWFEELKRRVPPN